MPEQEVRQGGLLLLVSRHPAAAGILQDRPAPVGAKLKGEGFCQKEVRGGGAGGILKKPDDFPGFRFRPVRGGGEHPQGVPGFRRLGRGDPQKGRATPGAFRRIGRFQAAPCLKQFRGGFLLGRGFGGGQILDFPCLVSFSAHPQQLRHHGGHRRIGPALHADFLDKLVREIETARADHRAKIGGAVLAGGFLVLGHPPAVGKSLPGSAALVYVGEHAQGTKVSAIQAVRRLGRLKGFDQRPALDRPVRGIHQPVRPPAFESAVRRQGNQCRDHQKNQQRQAQGQPTLPSGAACLVIPGAHLPDPSHGDRPAQAPPGLGGKNGRR